VLLTEQTPSRPYFSEGAQPREGHTPWKDVIAGRLLCACAASPLRHDVIQHNTALLPPLYVRRHSTQHCTPPSFVRHDNSDVTFASHHELQTAELNIESVHLFSYCFHNTCSNSHTKGTFPDVTSFLYKQSTEDNLNNDPDR